MSSNTFDTSNKIYTLENNTNNYDNNIETRFNIVLNLINDSDNKILDVGCYDGRYSKLFLKNGNIVYGIDASTEGINEAKKMEYRLLYLMLKILFLLMIVFLIKFMLVK